MPTRRIHSQEHVNVVCLNFRHQHTDRQTHSYISYKPAIEMIVCLVIDVILCICRHTTVLIYTILVHLRLNFILIGNWKICGWREQSDETAERERETEQKHELTDKVQCIILHTISHANRTQNTSIRARELSKSKYSSCISFCMRWNPFIATYHPSEFRFSSHICTIFSVSLSPIFHLHPWKRSFHIFYAAV